MMIMIILIVIIERLRAFRRTDQLEEHTVVMTMMMMIVITIVATIERLRAFRRLPRCLIDWWA